MKLQIDTKAKTIKVDETVKFEDLIKVLNKLLPKEWKSYSLETGSIINWYSPIHWHYYDHWTIPITPIPATQPWRIGDVTYTLLSLGDPIVKELPTTMSVYNVEC